MATKGVYLPYERKVSGVSETYETITEPAPLVEKEMQLPPPVPHLTITDASAPQSPQSSNLLKYLLIGAVIYLIVKD